MLAPLLLSTGLLASTSGAQAAEVTDLPSPLRGTAALSYDAAGDALRLVQEDQQVGARQHRWHTLSLDLEFSPVRAVVVGIELPVVLDERLEWSSAQQMAYDPTLGGGSMLGTEPLAPLPLEQGGGLAGPLFLVRLAPFHEQLYVPGRDRTSWVLELGYRLQDKSSFYREKADGSRGGGEGGDALHLRTAWSTARRTARPYLEATFDRAFAVPTPLRDTDGTVLVTEARVRPPSHFALRAGAELPALERDRVELAVDLRARAGYRSWQDMPSGLYLPDVLDASRSVLVTQGDAVWLTGGLGLRLRVTDLVDVRLGGDFGTETPTTIEHPYDIHSDLGLTRWAADLQVKVWLEDALLGLETEVPGGR